jgi:hypothetical protein
MKFAMRFTMTLFIFLICRLSIANPDIGKIAGKVIDKKTLNPLAGANVQIKDTNIGAASDRNGYFLITNLEPGSYVLEISYVGYKTIFKGNVIVNPRRTNSFEITMEEDPLQSETIQVKGSYFEKPKEAVVSTRSMDFEEIRRSAGDALDIQRTMQALPAVVSGSDQMNEIIVRGGIPGENLFLLDNIEIPNPNHFGGQGETGGPIHMINSYMVRKIDFYAGAFSSRFGDRASSVMDISLRDGTRDRLRFEGSVHMAGAGLLLEGPTGFANGSYIFSARKSYLDLIKSSIGLTAVPEYYDLQAKITLDLNPTNTLLINAVYGDDNIHIDEGEDDDTGNDDEIIDSGGSQTITGLTLRTYWHKNIYSHTTLSAVRNIYDIKVVETPFSKLQYKNKSFEDEYTLKSDFVYQVSKSLELTLGASFKSVHFDHDVYAAPDTIFWYRPDSTIYDYRHYPAFIINKNLTSFKGACYGQLSFDFLQRFRLTSGLRYDYFDYNQFESLSPRLGFSYFLNPVITLNLAYGIQYQSPAYIQITAHPTNKSLAAYYTEQYVAGIEYLLRADMKLVIETYRKYYYDVPVGLSETTPDPYDRDDGEGINKGTGYARGIEFFFQKKLNNGFSAILSYAYSISRAKDLRYNRYYNWDYDYRNVMTLMAGYKFKFYQEQWYQDFKQTLWYKILVWLPIGLADEYEISAKYRYLGGRPYTPPVYHPENQSWIVEENQPYNTKRYPIYSRFDLRIDRRYIYKNWNFVFFLEFWNIFNRDNIWGYQYDDDDGTKEEVLQFQAMPIVGLSIEF